MQAFGSVHLQTLRSAFSGLADKLGGNQNAETEPPLTDAASRKQQQAQVLELCESNRRLDDKFQDFFARQETASQKLVQQLDQVADNTRETAEARSALDSEAIDSLQQQVDSLTTIAEKQQKSIDQMQAQIEQLGQFGKLVGELQKMQDSLNFAVEMLTQPATVTSSNAADDKTASLEPAARPESTINTKISKENCSQYFRQLPWGHPSTAQASETTPPAGDGAADIMQLGTQSALKAAAAASQTPITSEGQQKATNQELGSKLAEALDSHFETATPEIEETTAPPAPAENPVPSRQPDISRQSGTSAAGGENCVEFFSALPWQTDTMTELPPPENDADENLDDIVDLFLQEGDHPESEPELQIAGESDMSADANANCQSYFQRLPWGANSEVSNASVENGDIGIAGDNAENVSEEDFLDILDFPDSP